MLKVGITGGIGSGKSIVSKAIEAMGYPVFNSDTQAKKLMNTSPLIREGLVRLVGEEAYVNGRLNRPFLAEKLFSDDSIRIGVNQLVHPVVRAAYDDLCSSSDSPIIFNEAAILFETGAHTQFDAMILITADQEVRLNRVIGRDQTTREQVLDRMNKQWSDDQKIPLADFVISNNPEDRVLAQVESVIESLLD